MHSLTYKMTFQAKGSIFNTTEKEQMAANLINDLCERHDLQLKQILISPSSLSLIYQTKPKYSPSEISQKIKGSFARTWMSQYPDTESPFEPGYQIETLNSGALKVYQTETGVCYV